MRGWIYVISNPAMPGLVKVGFSRQDPDGRAAQFAQTGVPHPYVVEYDVLLVDPETAELEVHRALHERREAKEWFRCSAEQVVTLIRERFRSRILAERPGSERRTPNTTRLINSRNAECPCGSGKKFKHCCGRPL